MPEYVFRKLPEQVCFRLENNNCIYTLSWYGPAPHVLVKTDHNKKIGYL